MLAYLGVIVAVLMATAEVVVAEPATRPGAAPATEPAKAAMTLDELVAKMPANLKPKAGESARAAGERAEWLTENAVGKELHTTMIVESIAPGFTSGEFKKGVYVSFKREVGPTPKYYKDDKLTIEGPIQAFTIDVKGKTSITLKSATVLSVDKK
jgi:hypothetical protein